MKHFCLVVVGRVRMSVILIFYGLNFQFVFTILGFQLNFSICSGIFPASSYWETPEYYIVKEKLHRHSDHAVYEIQMVETV